MEDIGKVGNLPTRVVLPFYRVSPSSLPVPFTVRNRCVPNAALTLSPPMALG